MMKRLICLLLFLAALCSCGGTGDGRGRIIPRATLQKIYMDLFLADEWLGSHDEYSDRADSTLLYEPIFRKYGYNTYDFRASVYFYLKDSHRFGKIIRGAMADLSEWADLLEKYLDAEDDAERVLSKLASAAPDFEPFPIAPEVSVEVDSVLYQRDTGRWYLPEESCLVLAPERVNVRNNRLKHEKPIEKLRMGVKR